jgi:membrane-associated phospholipid phosphatase
MLVIVIQEKIVAFDWALMLRIQALRRAWLTPVMKFFTYSGKARAWAIYSLGLWILQSRGVELMPQQALFLRSMLVGLVAFALGWVIKVLCARERPFSVVPGLRALVPVPLKDSFPSSHASTSSGLFVTLLLVGHPLAPWVGVWAVFVSFSRFYLGVHYPTDLAGGILFGTLCGLATAHWIH